MVYDARRYDDFPFGTFGASHNDMPFLSKLQRDSIYFDNTISPGVWTLPVHAAFFTGLPIFELRNDYFQPHHNTLPLPYPTIAQILSKEGYLTIAYADHPYFYSGRPEISLIRGFDYFNVIKDFRTYASITNIGTKDGAIVLERRLSAPKRLSTEVINHRVETFNNGEGYREIVGADVDAETGLLLPRLGDLFRKSTYFVERFKREFDRYLRPKLTEKTHYFIFFNNHMCTIAKPDLALYQEWMLQVLFLNAKRLKSELLPMRDGESFEAFHSRNAKHLHIRSGHKSFKQCFDNRFYDAYFELIYEYLGECRLLDNTVIVVTSDHGMALGEHGEETHLHGGARPFEYNVRVPLMIKAPKGSSLEKLHGKYDRRISSLDLFYTFLDLAGLSRDDEPVAPLMGVSILRRVRRNEYSKFVLTETSTRPKRYRTHANEFGEMVAIYKDNMKLVYAPGMYKLTNGAVERQPEPFAQLYDLSTDPKERRNVFSDRGETVSELLRVYRERYGAYEYRPNYKVSDSGTVEIELQETVPIFDDETMETLERLGYIQSE